MRQFVYAAAFVAGTVIASPASAQGGHTLFACTLGNGRTVSVTVRGDRFTYRYGTPRRAELTLTATPNSHTGFYLLQRHYAMSPQIRFTTGDLSYIVYEIPSHPSGDPRGDSGVTVLRGRHIIAHHSCRRLTELNDWDALQRLPEDEDRWDWLSLG